MSNQPDKLKLEVKFDLFDDDVENFVKLSLINYQDQPITHASVVRWKHLKNPFGCSIAIEVKKCGVTVGRLWLQRHEWNVLGNALPCLFPQDLLVDPEVRSFAVSLKLMRFGFEVAGRESAIFYHSSNPNSEPVYERILRISQASEMSCSMLPLEPIGILRWFFGDKSPGESRFRLPNRIWRALEKMVLYATGAKNVNLIQEPTELEQSRIVASFTQRQSCTNSRTPEWRSWRYEGSGAMTYRVFWFADSDKPIGYVVVSERDLEGIRCLFVVDVVWAKPIRPRSARKVIRYLVDHEISRNCKMLIFLGNYQNCEIKKFAKGLLFRIPSSLLPQRLPIYVRLGNSESPNNSLSSDELKRAFRTSYFTLADLDVI